MSEKSWMYYHHCTSPGCTIITEEIINMENFIFCSVSSTGNTFGIIARKRLDFKIIFIE